MKRLNLFKTVLLMSAAISLVGCTDTPPTQMPNEGGFSVDFSVDDISAETRSIATESEKTLNEAYLVFYENGANIEDQTYVTHQQVQINNNATSFPLPIPALLVPDKKYKVLVVANFDNNRPNGVGFEEFIINLNSSNSTYSSHKSKLYAQTEGRVKGNLPFFGKLIKIGEGSDLEALFTCPNSTTTNLGVKIIFKRAVSRFDLVNNVANQLHIETVKVCNYRDKGYLFHSDAFIGSVISGINDGSTAHAVANPVGTLQSVRGGIYGYPNVVTFTAQGDKFTTCLLIGGYYQTPDAPANTTKLSYYRANISMESAPQMLKANNSYTITINNVTAEGSPDEGGAIVDTDNKLDYETGSDWEDGDGNTNVDENGNFIIVSRTNVVFNSEKDLSEIINVKVKEGAAWSIEWIGANADFKADMIDNKSMSISTLNENINSAFTKNAKIRVKLVDVPAVFIDIDLIQLPDSEEIAMLTVDGKMGTINVVVPGQGTNLRFSVLTGTSNASWKATDENSVASWASFTPAGAHNGFFNIVLEANTSGKPRSGHIIISRHPNLNGAVEPVRIEFTQKVTSEAILIHTPQVGNIEGYRHKATETEILAAKTGGYVYYTFAGIKKPYIPYNVTLANPDDYTWQATINAPLLDIGLVNSTSYSNNPNATKASNIVGLSGEGIFLFVQNTGPGDPNIEATLTIEAIPRNSAPAVADKVIPITITTSCDIDYAEVGNFRVDDRNQGSLVPAKYDEDGVHTAALYYTNLKLTTNPQFKGDYYTIPQATCPPGWRMMARQELLIVQSRLVYSKSRPFLPSQAAPIDGRYDACYFGINGYAGNPSVWYSYYSSSESNANGPYLLRIYPDNSANGLVDTLFAAVSLRCVQKK